MSASPEKQLQVLRAGARDLVSEEELLEKLREGGPLRVKYGCDPSAPDLHLGHLIHLDKLRQFVEFGHRAIFLVGDFTAMIGDPSGRSRTRPALSADEVRRNAQSYTDQVGTVLDTASIEIRFNSEWMNDLTPADFIRLASHQPVARMLEREDFKQRYQNGVSIAIHEFLYPLVQAYDSVALEADLELGGTDQLFNLLLAREIQRAYGQPPQVVLTMPLLEGTDGREKMSKSVNNAIGLRDAPDEMYGKTMSIPDEILTRWVELLGSDRWTEVGELSAGAERGEPNPRDLKAALARRLVERFHGSEAANAAESHFERVFRQHRPPQDLPEVTLRVGKGRTGLPVVEILRQTDLVASNSEARRLVAQGGVRLDGARVEDPFREVEPGEHLVQVGKRRFLRVRVASE